LGYFRETPLSSNVPHYFIFKELDKPNKPEKPLAEKTIEDVLLHFGETKRVARRRYREFACAVKSVRLTMCRGHQI
jgi:hypothetical protein